MCELSKNRSVTSRFHNAFSIAEFKDYATTPGSFMLTLHTCNTSILKILISHNKDIFF